MQLQQCIKVNYTKDLNGRQNRKPLGFLNTEGCLLFFFFFEHSLKILKGTRFDLKDLSTLIRSHF